MSTETRALKQALLLGGDLACFLAFAVVGLRSHEDGVTLTGILRAAVPFQAAWLIANLAMSSHRRSAHDSRQVVRIWVAAWAIGLVLRTLLFDRSFEVTFALVALLVNGVLLLLWRSLIAPLVLRGR